MNRRRDIVAASLLLFTFLATVRAAADDFPLLRQARDTQLQAVLDRGIDSLALRAAVRRKALAVALVDISDPHHPRVATLNGDEMMYAASLPKIGILLGAFVEIENGRLAYTNSLKQSMIAMIRVSSNEEATRVMNLVGKHRINEILASKRFRLYDPAVNGGIWVGKEYGERPAFQRDPLHNISHGATVMQVARFYYLLETGRLLGPELSAEMKEVLSKPAIDHKFVKALRRPGVKLYRKSGTWRRWHADSALVEAPHGSYIIVALAEDRAGGEWLTRVARKLNDLIQPLQIGAG
jgi:beta-lactamase class A